MRSRLLNTAFTLLSLTLTPLALAQSSVNTARFTVTAGASTVRQGSSGTSIFNATNQGPDAATNTVLTYTPPTTSGVTVTAVSVTPGGSCALSGGNWICPAVPNTAVLQAVSLTVSMTLTAAVPTGPTSGSHISVNSAEFNPGSGVGESRFSTWGATSLSGAAGDAFWFAFDGNYNDTGPKVENGHTALSDLTGNWPVSQDYPIGAYSLKFDDPTYSSSDDPADPAAPASPTHPLPYAAYGSAQATVQPPLNQSVTTTPPTVSLPIAAHFSSQNNRRVWEVRTGIYLPQAQNVYVCVTGPDDAMYVAFDPATAGTVAAFAGAFTAGVVDSTSGTGTPLTAGYHELVYRIFNRNGQSGSFEDGIGAFSELGIGSAPSTSGAAGRCSTLSYDAFTRVAPASDTTVLSGIDLALTYTGPAFEKPGQLLDYTFTVTNNGTATATGALVTENLPQSMRDAASNFFSLISTTQGTLTYSSGSGVLSYQIGTLAPGATATLTFRVQSPSQAQLTAGVYNDLINTATVTLNETDFNPANNTASTTAQLIDPVLTKTVRNVTTSSSFASTAVGLPGNVLEYCIDAHNYGVNVNNFVINDALPPNSSVLLSAYGPGLGITYGRGEIFTTLTSAVDSDPGSLGTALQVNLGTFNFAENARVCFQTRIN